MPGMQKRNTMRESNSSYFGIRLALVAAILAMASGCSLVGSSNQNVTYVRGELEANLGRPFPAVVQATERAVSQLQFAPVRETKDSLISETVARTPDRRKVDIKITNEAIGLTIVTIRVGLLGNEADSRAILAKMQANL
jgi:hypothetical protein